ncbi:box C/D snoRNA protein 1 [Cydia amplana]|uniref:box C/D snoRNA protein 1 n=1 Tax=Cydia amplana TaxID=1869771 RepID=UPI002FE60C08
MSSSSDSEPETRGPAPRLGPCEVCASKEAQYTCPKCEVKTCCLNCVRIHKTELNCDGIRDRTKFVRMKDFTDRDLLSDYRLLEECARFVHGVKRDEKKRFTRIDKDLPVHLFKLKIAARDRGIALQFLAQNFSRHSVNTTRYNYKTNLISWRVEWIFPNAEPDMVKFVDEKCLETRRLSDLLDKYLDVNAEPFEGSKALTYYKSVGFNGVKVLLRAEKVRGCARKFFELDPSETLAENLSGKCIVEFPLVFVVLKDHAYNFDIITPEDEFDEEPIAKETPSQRAPANEAQKRKRPLLTEKVALEKQKEIQQEIKEDKKKKPKNLLFTTGYSSEESLDLSDDESKK